MKDNKTNTSHNSNQKFIPIENSISEKYYNNDSFAVSSRLSFEKRIILSNNCDAPIIIPYDSEYERNRIRNLRINRTNVNSTDYSILISIDEKK